MFKISHEVPISMLEESRDFNDYDYALVHVFEKSKEYFDFYKESLRRGRLVILDNSAYELGHPFNERKYVEFIQDLMPTEYILPDYRDDSLRNYRAIRDWNIMYPHLKGQRIGVVHGNSYEDYCQNYKDISCLVDKVAFSVESFFFEYEGIERAADVRIAILERMVREGIIDENKNHHILGALSPTEYCSFTKYSWIESADTSNPILHGLIGKQYLGRQGLQKKSKVKMDSLMHLDVSESQKSLIYFNLNWFRAGLKEDPYKDTDFDDPDLPKKLENDLVPKIESIESDAEKEASAEYYRHFPIETYDLMVKIWGEEAIAQWCEITAFKYRMRLGIKDPSKIEVDLAKEKNYLNKAKELREISI